MTISRKYAFFSTGIPDPSQGGSGMFNYLVLRHLLEQGCKVRAYFRVNPDFVKRTMSPEYLAELEGMGLERYFVVSQEQPGPNPTPRDFLLANHQAASCAKVVGDAHDYLAGVDGCISLDLGWALALGKTAIPSLCILGDPVGPRLAHTPVPALGNPGAENQLAAHWHRLAQALENVTVDLLSELNPSTVLGCLSPAERQTVSVPGLVDCKHVRWFTIPPRAIRDPSGNRSPTTSRDRLTVLHVGDLATTASRNMLSYWRGEVLPALGKLPFTVEIRMVGRLNPDSRIEETPDNVSIIYPGHVVDLTDEFLNADLYLSLMHYPVGIRTRVITALSYGIPVIADPSITFGLPELRHGEQLFYAPSAAKLASLLRHAYENPTDLARVGAAGRAAWERWYNPEINLPDLVSLVPVRA
jgi:hypothetical protein